MTSNFSKCLLPWMQVLKLFVCLFALNTGLAVADQNATELPSLFDQLRASNSEAAKAIEDKIWTHWDEHSNAEVTQLMDKGKTLMNRRAYQTAESIFIEVTEMAPDYAEGWNKLATVNYLMHNHVDSVRYIHKTLTLEPRHFGALSGMGLIFLSKGDLVAAQRAFEEVLKISPQSSSARYYADQIREQLGDPA